MDKVSLTKIIEDYIKAIEAYQFQDFCDRLLLTLYPDEYTPVRAGGKNGDMKNDGYCYISRIFYHAHASRGETIAKIKDKIRADLEGCLKKQDNVQKFIYLTNDTLVGEVEKFVDDLRVKHNNIVIETWGPKKLGIKIIAFEPQKIGYIIDRNLSSENIDNNAEIKNVGNQIGIQQNYYSQTASDENDYGIIEEIFEYIFENVVTVKDETIKPKKEKLKELLDKIKINFNKNQQKTVKQIISDNWRRKELVERFVKIQIEIDDLRILALKDFVQSKYRKLLNVVGSESPINDFTVFEKLGLLFLPEKRKTNPDYVSNAKAIILYFFEFCDIGKKSDKEVEENNQNDLFKDID